MFMVSSRLTILALSPESKNGQRPAVLLPNPFYQCYAVAATMAGAEPIYLPCTAETGHLPDFAGLPADMLARTTVAYICSPANPQGAVADRAYWNVLLDLAGPPPFTKRARGTCHQAVMVPKVTEEGSESA